MKNGERIVSPIMDMERRVLCLIIMGRNVVMLPSN